MTAETSTVTLETISDTGSRSSVRKLILRGGALPKQSVEWSGQMRVNTRFYTGNSRGTQQVLGPTELPSTWGGEWHLNMLARSPVEYTDELGNKIVLIHPDLIADAAESIFRSGLLLRVTWSAEVVVFAKSENGAAQKTKRLVQRSREGRCTKFKHVVSRAEDIEWSWDFDWLGRTEEPATIRLGNTTPDFFREAKVMKAHLDVLKSARDNQKEPGFGFDFGTNLNMGLLEFPKKLFKQTSVALAKSRTSLTNALDTPNKVYRDAASALDTDGVTTELRGIYETCWDTHWQLTRLPLELMTLPSARRSEEVMNATIAQMKYQADMIIFIKQSLVTLDAARAVATRGALDNDTRAAGGDASADTRMYRTKEGDTPVSVSMRFFNSPDFGAQLLQANRMSWYTASFKPGTVLVIPKAPGKISV
jgi:hypothetical protein